MANILFVRILTSIEMIDFLLSVNNTTRRSIFLLIAKNTTLYCLSDVHLLLGNCNNFLMVLRTLSETLSGIYFTRSDPILVLFSI